MTRTTRYASGVAALVATGLALGAGSTASNTMPTTTTAGYGSVTVTGATVSSIGYTVNTAGTTITDVLVTFSATQVGRTVLVGFSGGTPVACTVTTTTCTVSGLTQLITAASSVAVTVYDA